VQTAVSILHAGALVQTPPSQLSLFRQQPFVEPQEPPVAPQRAGATQVPPTQESVPLQQGWLASQVEAPVPMQVALAVQTPLTQPSAALQQGVPPPHAAPVPAQVAAPVQTVEAQVSAEQQVPQLAPRPPQSPEGPTQKPPEQVMPLPVQHAGFPPPHGAPRAAQVGAVQTLPVQASFASQQERPPAQEAFVAAQVVRWRSFDAEPPPEQPASASAAARASARGMNVGRAVRDMALPQQFVAVATCGSNREKSTRASACRCSGVCFWRPTCAFAAPGGRSGLRASGSPAILIPRGTFLSRVASI
jgi:hypothetical protein